MPHVDVTDTEAIRLVIKSALAQTWHSERSFAKWHVVFCHARDHFKNCTLTVEQWLANDEPDGFWRTKADKWEALMCACALALPSITKMDGLRLDPRVGYDPAGDQPFFLFKTSNNGITFIVSPYPIDLKEAAVGAEL